MVAYFRLQNNLCMILGAALGVLAAVFGLGDVIAAQVVYIRLFLVAMCALAGVVLGRLLSAAWANVRLRRLNQMLYGRCDPAAFLTAFEPIARRVPANTVERCDAQTKIAYACEALGQVEKGLEAIGDLSPRDLKLHALQCTALVENQRMRLYLLGGDREAAAKQLETLDELQKVAASRAPVLGTQLGECVRLGRTWLNILLGEECDLELLESQIQGSQNRIHKAEMQLLLGLALRSAGRDLDSREALAEAVATAPDLYAGQRAKAELGI